MEAPDKIYVSRPIYNQCGLVISEDKPIKYVRKDLLLKWAKENLLECEVSNDEADYGRIDAYKKLIDKLNSL